MRVFLGMNILAAGDETEGKAGQRWAARAGASGGTGDGVAGRSASFAFALRGAKRSHRKHSSE